MLRIDRFAKGAIQVASGVTGRYVTPEAMTYFAPNVK
jgi:hypothetical protein